MDIFSQKKFMIWTITLLVLLNIISLATLWYQRSERPPQQVRQGEQRQESVTQFLNRELQLADDQKKEFERLRREYVDASTKLNEEIRAAKKSLFDLLAAPAPEKTTIDKLTGEIGTKQAQLDLMLFNHLTALRTLCTPVQRDKFNTILREIRDLMRPQNPAMEKSPPPRNDGQGVRQREPDQQKRPRDPNDQGRPPQQGRKGEEKQRPPRD